MVTVLAVADGDSYLKWSAATLDQLPASWERRQLLLASPITPSPAQAVAAAGGQVARLRLGALRRLLRAEPPDVLVLACTGPTVRVLAGLAELRGPGRPVLVTGLPGISVPASARAVDHRRGCDLLVVHSHRERREFAGVAAERAPSLRVVLSRLPFLDGVDDHAGGHDGGSGGGSGEDVVFAAQAKVPSRREDRESILLALAAVRPVGSAVIKLRALPGEQQTHHEQLPYPDLWSRLVAAGRVEERAVRFAAGPMRQALAGARCLVTVSSTAALEAIAAEVPVVVLTDFGVDARMINLVFEGSGCLGDLADVRAGRAGRPTAEWRADNYFHPAEDNDLAVELSDALLRRRTEGLPPRPRPGRFDPTWWRAAGRLLLPGPGGRFWLPGAKRPDLARDR